MPLTYHDVMTTQLHMLVDAAKAWEKMGNRFGELKTNFDDNVLKVTGDGSWRGEGFQAATSASGIIKHEYSAAKAEALAIAEILHEAYTQFRDFKQAIDKVVKDAESKGYKVSATGGVTFDWESLTPEENRAMKNDSGMIAKAENDIANSIKKLVQKADDADHGVKLALNAAVTDQDGKGAFQGFNSAAEGDMEKVEAKRAAELATKLNSEDGRLSPTQAKEMSVLMRGNSADPAFSKTLLNTLGPEGTVKLSNRLGVLSHDKDAPGDRRDFRSIERGLAASLATATADDSYGKRWLKDMEEVGTKEFDGPGSEDDKVLGYQSIATLMQAGDPEDYSPKFLKGIGDDILAAERESMGEIWRIPQYSQPEWFANDPLDGVMGMMSEHPGTANEFLNPGSEAAQGNKEALEGTTLHYLLKERNWELVHQGGDPLDLPGTPTTYLEEDDARQGLGLALEAAATGHEPVGPHEKPAPSVTHGEGQANVMNSAIRLLDPGAGGNGLPENLQQPMANALANYAPDTHKLLDPAFDSGEDKNVSLNVNYGDIARVMNGVSEDPNAYGTIHDAERQQIMQDIAKLPPNADPADPEVIKTMRHSSAAFGAFDAIREDAITDARDDGIKEGLWKSRAITSMSGLATAHVPVGGPFISPLTDTWSHAVIDGARADATNEANAKIADQYLNANSQTKLLVGDWAVSAGHERNDDKVDNLQTDAMSKRDWWRRDILAQIR